MVGELGNSDVEDLLTRLTQAKTNNSPASIISSLVEQIYEKVLPPDKSDLIIKVAKYYDKLFMYGSNEVTQARAQFGNSLTEKDIIVHNTLIDVMKDFLNENTDATFEQALAYLDGYYARFNAPTAPTLGLL